MADGKRFKYTSFPFEIVDRRENEESMLLSSPSVFVGPKRYVEMAKYKKYALDIYNFEARPDDVYITGSQRTGTTLHGEMVWLIGNDLNFEAAKKDFLYYRLAHLDYDIIPRLAEEIEKVEKVNEEITRMVQKYQETNLEGLAKRTGRRFMKSHLPLSLMPPSIFEVGAKVIYCARNPKDVVVSTCYMHKIFKNSRKSDLQRTFQYFKHNKAWNTPYFEHVKEAWERRNDKNFLFLFYEDTIKDKRQTIRKVADFLGKDLSEEQIDSLDNHLNIENFKKNTSVNNDQLIKLGLANDVKNFIREGRTGGWRELFDKELNDEFDQLIEERLKGTDLRFPET